MRALAMLVMAAVLAGCSAAPATKESPAPRWESEESPTTPPASPPSPTPGEEARDAPPEAPRDPTLDDVMQERLDASFENRTCPVPKPHAESVYQGRLYDMHFHMPILRDAFPGDDDRHPPERPPYIGVDATVDDLACHFAYEGTSRALVFFSVFPRVASHHVDFASRVAERYPAIVPSISPPDAAEATVDVDVLADMVSRRPEAFGGYGEIGLYPTASDPDGTSPDDPRMRAIYPVLEREDLFAYFHLGAGMGAAFERAAQAHPNVTFVFHGDQLVEYEGARQNLSAIEGILARNPNVCYGVDELYGDEWLIQKSRTPPEFFAHFEDYGPLLAEDVERWKPFIERHPDQVFWGTDRGAEVVWSLDPEVGWTLNDYARAFIALLDPAVQEKFAWKNAEAIFEASGHGLSLGEEPWKAQR